MREYILYAIIILLTATNIYTYKVTSHTIDTLENSCNTLSKEVTNIQQIAKETDTLIASWTTAISTIRQDTQEVATNVEKISTPWDSSDLPDEYVQLFNSTKDSNGSKAGVSGTSGSNAAATSGKNANAKNK